MLEYNMDDFEKQINLPDACTIIFSGFKSR